MGRTDPYAIVADIGGTHARFALASLDPDDRVELHKTTTLRADEFPEFQSAWETFRDGIGQPLPDTVVLAVAAPVQDDLVQLSNNAWTFLQSRLATDMGMRQVKVINDFEAIGHAVAGAAPDRLQHLAGPVLPPQQDRTVTIVGPGTGLGVACLSLREDGYRVQPTEGGHIEFAPLDPLEERVRALFLQGYDRVSVERVLAGSGLTAFYRAVCEMKQLPLQELSDESLWCLALSDDDPCAAEALQAYCRTFGSVAGDLALAQGASAVVISGGLGYRIRDKLSNPQLTERFVNKGRFRDFMAAISVDLLLMEQPGLFGAACFAAQDARG